MSPSGAGPGAALSALSIGGGSEAVVRGELIAGDGGVRFAALRRLRWGTPILTERPCCAGARSGSLLVVFPTIFECFGFVLDLFWIVFGLFLDCIWIVLTCFG